MVPAMRELGRHGIRVMTIAPGYIQTPLMDQVPQEFQENLKSSQIFPRTRFGQPEEYARLCVTSREPDAQRRHHPPRRRHKDAAEVRGGPSIRRSRAYSG